MSSLQKVSSIDIQLTEDELETVVGGGGLEDWFRWMKFIGDVAEAGSSLWHGVPYK